MVQLIIFINDIWYAQTTTLAATHTALQRGYIAVNGVVVCDPLYLLKEGDVVSRGIKRPRRCTITKDHIIEGTYIFRNRSCPY